MAVDSLWGSQYDNWLEGGAVLSREVNVLDELRVNNRESETAAYIEVSNNGRKLSIDPKSGFIHFPGGCNKFVVRFDGATVTGAGQLDTQQI